MNSLDELTAGAISQDNHRSPLGASFAPTSSTDRTYPLYRPILNNEHDYTEAQDGSDNVIYISMDAIGSEDTVGIADTLYAAKARVLADQMRHESQPDANHWMQFVDAQNYDGMYWLLWSFFKKQQQ